VAGDAEQVLAAFDLSREEVGAEEVRVSRMELVVEPRVPRMQLLERLRHARVRDSEDRVVVVAEQRVLDEAELEPLDDLAQALEERAPRALRAQEMRVRA